MKKRFSILAVSVVIAGIALSLVGTVLVSQAAPTEKGQNMDKPIPATDVKIVKKTLHPEIGEIKGKPATPPGKDKNGSEKATTGVLGGLAQGNKYAVVIGICDYPGTNNDICWSDGDSLNMYQTLTGVYGYDPLNVHLLRDMDATYDAIRSAVEDIRTNEQPGDEVVFFFSGHGADGIAQDTDAETRDEGIVAHNGTNLVVIWDGELRNWFSSFDTSRIVFVFDSCLAGGMNDVSTEGRVVAMATGETQVAYVYSKGEPGITEGEGVFSYYFVNEGMLQGLADKYDHISGVPDVVVEEAFDYAKEIIPGIYKRQNPVISDSFIDDLLL